MANSDNTFGTFNKITKVMYQKEFTFVNYATNNIDLNGAHNSSVTTIAVTDASALPSAGYLHLEKGTGDDKTFEIIAYTGKSGNNITGCTRGAALPHGSATTALSFADGDTVAYSTFLTKSQSFSGNLTTAKNTFLTSDAQACINDNGTQVQFAITSDGNGLKWTVAFGVPASTDEADSWAKKYKDTKKTLSDGNNWIQSGLLVQDGSSTDYTTVDIADDSDHLF